MEVIEDKSLFVYDYVNLKNRALLRKHGKKRSLGDVDGRYRYHTPKQTENVMGSLINLDFPETRAINTKSANTIISDQSRQIQDTYHKTFRSSTLQVWSRPESSLEDRPYSSLDNRPGTAPENQLDLQPQVSSRHATPRPHTTGSRNFRTPSRQPPHPSGFMVVKMKPDGSVKNLGLKGVTEQIRDWWEEDDRRERDKARKAQSQHLKRYDSFAGQWLSFVGNVDESAMQEGAKDGGVIEAFTGNVPSKDEFYNIESAVGATVATQLRTGNKVRVGVNGELLSDSLKVKKWKNEELDRHPASGVELPSNSNNNRSSKRDSIADIFREARAEAPAVTPLRKETEGRMRRKAPEDLIPLSWSEQVSKPNVKVMGLREPRDPASRQDLSERHPVVFHPLIKDGRQPQGNVNLGKYRINQHSRSKIGIDGTESLNNRITRITVDQISRTNGGQLEMTDEDYENLLKERLRSVNVDDHDDDDDEDENGDVAGEMQQDVPATGSPRRKLDDMQEESMYSLGKESEMSGLTVEKPPTVRSQDSAADFGGPLCASPLGSHSPMRGSPPGRPYIRQVASAAPRARQTQSADLKSLRAPPRSIARSAGSQRMQPSEYASPSQQRIGASSAGTQRTLSASSSRRKYAFDQNVTPSNAHSPRPNLARPGHLPRSKVPSISSTGPQEGDTEYINISHRIPKPGEGGRSWNDERGLSAISRVSDMNQLHLGSGDMKEPSISSMDDGMSVDSMNVHRGEPHLKHQGHYHEDGTACTCTPEAKRVMSAAMSAARSHVPTDLSVIQIPTAPMTPSELDRNSLSDMDPLSSTSTFRRPSLGDDDWKEATYDADADEGLQYHEPADPGHGADSDMLRTENQPGRVVVVNMPQTGSENNPPGLADGASPTPSREIIVNRHDGLDSLGITPPRSAGKKRTVKFSDEIDEPYVPFTSPMSTPRDPAHPGSVEGSINSGEFVTVEDRADLSVPLGGSRPASGAAARQELSELRAKIKSDLQQSQVETEQDLEALKSN